MLFLVSLDQSLFKLINQTWTSTWADWFFPFITDLNKAPWFPLTVGPLLLFFYVKKFKKFGVFLFLMCALAIGFSDFSGNQIKHLIERQRPFEIAELTTVQRSPASGFSFVSNHASNMIAFATFTSMFFPSAAVPSFLVAFLVGYSRVYNGVHFPGDVLGGAAFGACWGLLFALISKKILQGKLK